MNRIKVKTDIVYTEIKKDIIIVHLSDIHFNTNIKMKDLNKLEYLIQKINPHYVMITGDTLDTPEIVKNQAKIKDLLTFLTDLAKFTKIIISIGNHDVRLEKDYLFFNKLNDFNNIYVLDNTTYEDNEVFVTGFTLPIDYYYNINGGEDPEIFTNYLDSKPNLIKKLPNNKVKIALIHSPIRLTDSEVFKRLSIYDLILSGHTHNGMVPDILNFLFKKNIGIIAPNKKLFPEIAKGKIEKELGKRKTTIIINGGYTKLSKKSGKSLSHLNCLYNKSVNKILVRKKRGIKYEN